jgi:Cytotoxic translational repressor of toxin-antitoxin stability system
VAAYKVVIKPSAAKNLDQIDRRVDRERVAHRIQGLAENPRPFGSQKLEGVENTFRVRQGDYRIVYDIDDGNATVIILKVRNRKDVYRGGRA